MVEPALLRCGCRNHRPPWQARRKLKLTPAWTASVRWRIHFAGEESCAAHALLHPRRTPSSLHSFWNLALPRLGPLVPPHAESNAASTASIILLCLGLDHCYPTPNSTQPPELLKPPTVTMDNAEEHIASLSFGPPRLQKFEPSTTLTGEEEVASRLDSLIEMEDNCDNMFVFTNNMVDRSFDLDKEDDSYLTEDDPCFAPVQSSVAPTPNSTQPPELL
jgi:hypothetical protein